MRLGGGSFFSSDVSKLRQSKPEAVYSYGHYTRKAGEPDLEMVEIQEGQAAICSHVARVLRLGCTFGVVMNYFSTLL